MVDQETKLWIADNYFRLKSFESLWFDIKQTYETMGFTDKISDEEKIQEYTYISKQLHKYISTKQEGVLAKDTYEEMVFAIEDLISRADEYASTRKEIVYNMLRDHWLLEVHDLLNRMADYYDDDEEEE